MPLCLNLIRIELINNEFRDRFVLFCFDLSKQFMINSTLSGLVLACSLRTCQNQIFPC